MWALYLWMIAMPAMHSLAREAVRKGGFPEGSYTAGVTMFVILWPIAMSWLVLSNGVKRWSA